MNRGFYGVSKHDKEIRRQAKRLEKAERLAARKAAKQAVEQFDNGTFPIDDLPADAQGVFRTLSRKLPNMTGEIS
jgi:hypothetical protein